MLALQKFILSNPNWMTDLKSPPYSLRIQEHASYYIFMYTPGSDMSNEIVQESRGIILCSLRGYIPVCVPFFKFFNVHEKNAARIDWDTARVQEKIDGSIIKVWWSGMSWHISTNGKIDAFTSIACDGKSFGNLFVSALESLGETRESFERRLNKNRTYMFELVSPQNRITISYGTDPTIYHIGTRDNKTLEEINEDIGVVKPREYFFSSLDDCIDAARNLPFSEEGYVVVDGMWNRLKIKSPAYVNAHHLVTNGAVSQEKIINFILSGEDSEFLSYFPDYEKLFLEMRQRIIKFSESVSLEWELRPRDPKSRREFAMWAKDQTCPPAMFMMLDGKIESIGDWIMLQTPDKILPYLDY